MKPGGFEIFLAAPPGLEETLREEARLKGFRQAQSWYQDFSPVTVAAK